MANLSPRSANQNKPNTVGGLPLIEVAGTPRTMGQQLADAVSSRLRVLTQDTHDRLEEAFEAA